MGSHTAHVATPAGRVFVASSGTHSGPRAVIGVKTFPDPGPVMLLNRVAGQPEGQAGPGIRVARARQGCSELCWQCSSANI